MCGIFGVMDYSTKGYNLIPLIESLGKNSVVRGSHATGITALKDDILLVKKEPISSTKFNFKDIYSQSKIYMGHVRLATTGKPELNFNNHPFLSKLKTFSLAHNGILYYTEDIKASHNIKSNKIETDTYLAVQLLDKYPKVTLKTIKYMCENVIGEFVFTILDKNGNMFFAKKDNPITILDFYKLGVIVYASTEQILFNSIDNFVQLHEATEKKEFRIIKIKDGEIIRIKKEKENKIVVDRKNFDLYKEEDILDTIWPEKYNFEEKEEFPCDKCTDLNCSNCLEFDKMINLNKNKIDKWGIW